MNRPPTLPRYALVLALAAALSPLPANASATAASSPATASASAEATRASSRLLEVFELALQHDARWRAAQAAAAAQRERLPLAQAQLLPQVSLSLARTHNDLDRVRSDFLGRPVRSLEQFFSQNETLNVRQALLRPALQANVRLAQALVLDADATLENAELDLGERLLSAYLDALLALQQQTLLTAQLEQVRTQLQAAQRAFALGVGIRTDIDEAQARLDMLQAQLLQVRLRVETTRRALMVMTATPLGQLHGPQIAAQRLPTTDATELYRWLERAHQGNPQLQALRARVQAARHDLERARSGHLPTLDAVLQHTRSASESVTAPNDRHRNTTIGLQFNMPLYTGGGVSAQVRQAVAELMRAQETLEAAEREIGLEVQREFSNVLQGSERVRAHEVALRSAEQVVRSNQRSFEGGARTVLDVLNAEQQRQQAELELARTFFDYALASYRLQALAGTEPRLAMAAVQALW